MPILRFGKPRAYCYKENRMKLLKHMIISLMISSIINNYAIACEEQTIHKEIKEILQLAIDLPALQQYYHNRKPLIIEESNYINNSYIKGLIKFDLPVKFIPKEDIAKNNLKNYLTIKSWNVSSSGIRAEFEYKTEGIRITYEFKKDYSMLKWYIKKSRIVEY